MEKVTVKLSEKSYDIHIGSKILSAIADNFKTADKVFVLTDSNINKLYRGCIEEFFLKTGCFVHAVLAGESAKSFECVSEIIDKLTQFGMTRKSLVVAFGGGVVGDLAGFCAAIYMRGVRYIQIPTTLLAQIDSSIGGKTGINTRLGKNLAGCFYQPQAVYCDTNFLHTLSDREFRAGLGEMVKYGLIEARILDYIVDNYPGIMQRKSEVMTFLVHECCRIKAAVVSRDETETGVRKVLNIGHTFGHALETATGYKRYVHGEAVLIGIYYETLLAQALQLINRDYAKEIFKLIGLTGIDIQLEHLDVSGLSQLMCNDKKSTTNTIGFILPVGRDKYSEQQLSLETVEKFCNGINR